MKKRTLIAAVTAAAIAPAIVSAPAAAASFPDREVKLVIPFAPGGATDVVFRVISEAAEKSLGKPIVPMNMGGAGGSKGSTFVKNSRADGYTLLGGHEFLLTTYYGHLVNFGLDAFEPVCTLTETPLTVSAGKHVPYNTYQEMIDYVRKNPGKAVIAMTPASVGYVFWKEIARTANLDLDKHFRTVIINGVGPQTTAILGKHVDMAGGDLPSHIEYLKDGRLKLLGVAGDVRQPQAPDMPTLKELGYNAKVGATRAVFAPKGTPKEAIAKIAAAYEKACKDPAVMKRIADLGSIMTYKNPEETRVLFKELEHTVKTSLADEK